MSEERKTVRERALEEFWQEVKEKYMASKDKGEQREPVGHWPDLFAPPDFNDAIAAVKVVVNRVKGTEADNVKAIHAGLTVAMFGNSQLPHDEHPPLGRGTVTDEEAVRVLEGAIATHGQRGADDPTALPWAAILGVIVPLILKWFQNR